MEKFFAAVRNMFNVPDLRRRIFFTLGLLAVYRFGAHVGAPGINKARLDEVWRDVAGTLLGVLDLFSGGNFRTISVFALGVTPYITASIILQLMTVVSPQLKKLQEEGEMGRQKINQWTRYLTVVLAAIQTSFVAHWLQVNGVGDPGWGFRLSTVLKRNPQPGAPTPLTWSQCATNDVWIAASTTVRYRVHWLIFCRPISPSSCSFFNWGETTVISCRMIDAVMYGVTPSANTEMVRKFPPEKRSRTPRSVPATSRQTSSSLTRLTPGAVTCAPSR